MKKIILFDMDGTLTPPRQQMPMDIELALKEIQDNGYEIGIITGSDLHYVKQQCSKLFDLSLVDTHRIHFLPCNGTKYYHKGEEVYSNDMKGYMGDSLWNRMMTYLITKHSEIVMDNNMMMPLSGHFFDYRGSMLNWCPIGRNATQKDRKVWEFMDKDNFIRKPILEEVREFIRQNIDFVGDLSSSDVEIKVKLGGDTSFDIFPKGWDKTYPLEQTDIFKSYDIIHFVGDRCDSNGNDYEIYNHPVTIGHKTTSTHETIKIVNKILSSNV